MTEPAGAVLQIAPTYSPVVRAIGFAELRFVKIRLIRILTTIHYFYFMRLKNNELAAIKEVTKEVFGENATVRLFGSRTNDTLKGGDIDLLIHCNCTISNSEKYQLKIKFLVQLKKIVGDQKIDILIEGNQQQSGFFQTVKNEGILL